MLPTKLRVALGFSGSLALTLGCAHVEADEPGPAAPAAPAPAPAKPPPSAPETRLKVSSFPIEVLRSAYFSPLELSFQNPSGQWHQVRRITIGPERQLFGPAIEPLVGEHLRAWQLAAREAQEGKKEPRHPALETLAPEAPAAKPDGAAEAPLLAPPNYLLVCPFTIAPGLFTRKWVVLYSAAPDALLGQDLVLSYELEDGKTERVLIQYPKPAPPKP